MSQETTEQYGDGEIWVPNMRPDFDAAVHKIYVPGEVLELNSDAWDGESNCYSYALNLTDHGWGEPGHLLLEEDEIFSDSDVTVERIGLRLKSDGLVEVSVEDAKGLSEETHLIAAFIHERWDFHFYRRDHNGLWSHKNGFDSPIAHDDCSLPIRDIFRAETGEYDQFVGFFKVPGQGVVYYPRLKSEPVSGVKASQP